MTFTNIDDVQEKVKINLIISSWKVREQVEKQAYGQVYSQVSRNTHHPIKIKIYKETRK